MAPIVSSFEIARPPEEVFSYVTDPSRLAEWQESVVSTRIEGSSPTGAGSRVVVTRRIGRVERAMTSEMTELSPSRSWGVRGVDGPVMVGTLSLRDSFGHNPTTVPPLVRGRSGHAHAFSAAAVVHAGASAPGLATSPVWATKLVRWRPAILGLRE